MGKKSIYKEEVVDFLVSKTANKIIYISSNIQNLEYYYNSFPENDFKIKYINLTSYSDIEFIGVNVEIIEFLKSKERGILLLEINIALRVFFDEVIYKSFKIDEEYNREEIIEFLINNGYKKEYMLENKGEFSIRGDILDIYPSNLENPIRLDFFDDKLENIKEFSVYDQKSITKLNEIKIYSNLLFGVKREIVEMLDIFNEKKIELFIENKELVDIKLEHLVIIDRDNEEILKKRYENIVLKSELLEVSKNQDRNYSDEIKKNKEKLNRKGIRYKNVAQILEKDYVIHVEFGIGIYNGIVNINERDYLYIQYADNDKLYIPVEKLDRISKYVSVGQAPKLYSLGTKGFNRKQKKLRQDVEEFAKELLKIQAKRDLIVKKPFTLDTLWQEEFEEKFPFNLTMDQQKALNDIKHDLESGKLMDRILIGDVGYGKTEVALRAAFKAIENGYQCVLLAPTTVLANQHYERCHKRFEEYGVRVENLSRLSGGKNKEDIIKGLKEGRVDLVVGTHSLLSDSIKFNNLGLLIIDEEQKFGVNAKEKIKKKKEDIHLLTMSATPIPRTLNLALLGIRNISIISSSPMDRLPIITKKIQDYEVKDAILKEISRDGQVFYITNDVKRMPETRKKLKEVLPDFIKIEYLHGQLTPNEIKSIINDFDEGKFDVLIASTIVENGIDISNANTIIIEKFTSLGLSQLYQLRGRVGRSKRQGYCYLLEQEYKTKKGKEKEKSIEKVEGIEGGGYVLSLEDLNIRGAGEILGEKQHGVIDTLGYDFYLKMLKNEISKLKGEKILELRNVEINLKNNGYIPEYYIEKDERILIYKRYAEITNIGDLKELNLEIRDRFGKIPKEMLRFIYTIFVKLYMLENNIAKIIETDKFKLYMQNSNNLVEISKSEFLKRVPKKLLEEII